MILKINGFVKELFNVRDIKDRRKKIDKYIISYLDEDGIEYRKSFDFPVGYKIDRDKDIPKIIVSKEAI